MRAVNLMPDGGRSGTVSSPGALLNPAYGVIAVLVVALGLVTVYVLASNSVSSRTAQLTTLQSQVQTAQAQANQLTNYASYEKLAQARVSTVQQIANGRFDWHAALANLALVMPSDAALQSLLATVAPGASVSGAGGSAGGAAGTSSLRSDIQSPAFEVKGCAASHDDVARLLSRLRTMPGVQRVTLADSMRNDAGSSGSSDSGASAASASKQGVSACGANPANFDLVIFFVPLAGSTSTGGASAPVTTPAGAASAASSATSTTTSTSTTATAQPVSTGGSG
jgi:Tfp pilus assembly protein PilN